MVNITLDPDPNFGKNSGSGSTFNVFRSKTLFATIRFVVFLFQATMALQDLLTLPHGSLSPQPFFFSQQPWILGFHSAKWFSSKKIRSVVFISKQLPGSQGSIRSHCSQTKPLVVFLPPPPPHKPFILWFSCVTVPPG